MERRKGKTLVAMDDKQFDKLKQAAEYYKRPQLAPNDASIRLALWKQYTIHPYEIAAAFDQAIQDVREQLNQETRKSDKSDKIVLLSDNFSEILYKYVKRIPIT